MYQDLVLATDGSGAADRAAEHALSLAAQLEATLHVVSVAEDGPHSAEKRDEMRSDLEGEAAEAVTEVERAAREAGVEVTTQVLEGVAQEAIVDFAERNAVDLLVVGTAARSGLDELLAGSVAEEVIETAPVPVVTVRADI